MIFPLSLSKKVEIHVAQDTKHIHLLDITDKQINKKQMTQLIKKLCNVGEVNAINWNFIFYGQAKAYGVSTNMATPLDNTDTRLYHPFKSRMYLSGPFRYI